MYKINELYGMPHFILIDFCLRNNVFSAALDNKHYDLLISEDVNENSAAYKLAVMSLFEYEIIKSVERHKNQIIMVLNMIKREYGIIKKKILERSA